MLKDTLPVIRDVLQEDIHNKIILITATNLLNSGYYVLADHVNWSAGAPPKIFKHTPDIYAYRGESKLIVEVETRDSFNSGHALSQIKSFNSAAEKLNGICYLILPQVSIGLNEHLQKALINIRRYKLSYTKLASCDVRTNILKLYN